jgi:hypothetical protein
MGAGRTGRAIVNAIDRNYAPRGSSAIGPLPATARGKTRSRSRPGENDSQAFDGEIRNSPDGPRSGFPAGCRAMKTNTEVPHRPDIRKGAPPPARREKKRDASAAPAEPPTHEAIAQRAYELWVKDGSPEQRDQNYWFQAESELSGAPGTGSEPAPDEPSQAETRNDIPALRH